MNLTKVKWYGREAKEAARRGSIDGLRQAAEKGLEASQRLVPVSPYARGGYLKSTGKISVDESVPVAAISYDSPPGKHIAIWVHERLDVRHTSGSAKFLERPLNEMKSGILSAYTVEIGKRFK